MDKKHDPRFGNKLHQDAVSHAHAITLYDGSPTDYVMGFKDGVRYIISALNSTEAKDLLADLEKMANG